MSTDPILRARSDLGNATRRGDAAAVTAARRDLAAANIEAAIKRTVASAPPLTDEQRERLAGLLWEGGTPDA